MKEVTMPQSNEIHSRKELKQGVNHPFLVVIIAAFATYFIPAGEFNLYCPKRD